MRVVVTVLEAHFVGVRVRVRIMAMRVLVHDVIVLVRVMRMVVTLLTVRVLMAVRCRVVVELVHVLSFLPLFCSALRFSSVQVRATVQASPLPSWVT